MAELVFNIALIVLLAGQYLLSLGIGGRQVSSDHFGPQGFPRLLIVLCIILLVGLSIRALPTALKPQGGTGIRDRRFFRTPLCLSVLVLTLYVAALGAVGYMLATLCAVFLLGRAMGYAKNVPLGLYSLVLTGALVFVFGWLFAVPLPRGIGWLREISYLIY